MEANARLIGSPISTKQCIEICTFIRGKSVKRALTMLTGVVNKTEAVPYRRFNADVGHKRGIGPGRYPIKAAKEFIALIKSAVANAKAKEMDEKTLYISMIKANKASTPVRQGRQRGRTAKRTHIDVELVQKEEKKSGERKGKGTQQGKKAPVTEKKETKTSVPAQKKTTSTAASASSPRKGADEKEEKTVAADAKPTGKTTKTEDKK